MQKKLLDLQTITLPKAHQSVEKMLRVDNYSENKKRNKIQCAIDMRIIR